MRIQGIEHLTPQQLERDLAEGGRFVFYEYCISLIFISLRRPTSIYYLRPGEIGILRGLPFVFLSLILGWWGIPWGIIYTPLTIITNLAGGRDVTHDVQALLPPAS